MASIHNWFLRHGIAVLMSITGNAFAGAGSMSGPNVMCLNEPCRSIALHSSMLRERISRRDLSRQTQGVSNNSPLTLLGQLDGDWSDVYGAIVLTNDYTATEPALGHMQILLRSLPAQHEAGSNRYRVQWDRSVHWLDFDGAGPRIPHLLGTIALLTDYIPSAVDDPFPEFSSNAAVMAQCTSQNPCSVNITPYTLLREPGVDYSTYPELAASADVLFVAGADGQPIAISLDVFDENEEFPHTKAFAIDDQLQLSTIAYKVSEPGFLYVTIVSEFQPVTAALAIELANHIPGVDFPDPELGTNFNAAQRSIKLLLEADNDSPTNLSFAFSGPFNVGFNWGSAQDFLHKGNFEDLRPQPNTQFAPMLVGER